MATTRIKDLTNTATTVASDEYLAVDGTTNGTSKITRDNFRTDTAAAFVAAPGTYNLAPLSGGAVPIDKGGTAATTAAGARTSLDVPSNSEAVLVANNLSDVTAATARTNLSVNSVDEDAEGIGTKLLGPSVYFDGSNDYVEVADDAKLSFTDGTDDLPFSISAWVKMEDATGFWWISKYLNTVTCEFLSSVNNSDKLSISLYSGASANSFSVATADTLTAYEGQWVHLCITYGGAGPNSTTAFASAADEVSFYLNGASKAKDAATYNGTYAGITDTAQPVWIGRQGTSYAKGHIRNVSIYNRELTASEVADLAKGNELGFSDQWGDHTANIYSGDSADFASSLGNWTEYGATSITVAQSGGVAQITNTASSISTSQID